MMETNFRIEPSFLPNRGDMIFMDEHLHVCIDERKWTRVADLPVQLDHCLYCGSGWNESSYHPGTCGNCGASALLGKQKEIG